MSAPFLPDAVTAAMVSDALDVVGRRERLDVDGLRPVTGPGRCLGRVRTVAFVPDSRSSAGDDPYADMIEVVDGLRPGDVLVVSTGGSRASAVWGELFSAAALGRGAAGVLTDGLVRDAERIETLGFPVFARGTTVEDYKLRQRVESAGAPVTLGGLRIEPGQLLLADRDGVVVVPADVEDEVRQLALTRAARETDVLSDLRGGALLREVWERYRTL